MKREVREVICNSVAKATVVVGLGSAVLWGSEAYKDHNDAVKAQATADVLVEQQNFLSAANAQADAYKAERDRNADIAVGLFFLGATAVEATAMVGLRDQAKVLEAAHQTQPSAPSTT